MHQPGFKPQSANKHTHTRGRTHACTRTQTQARTVSQPLLTLHTSHSHHVRRRRNKLICGCFTWAVLCRSGRKCLEVSFSSYLTEKKVSRCDISPHWSLVKALLPCYCCGSDGYSRHSNANFSLKEAVQLYRQVLWQYIACFCIRIHHKCCGQ